MTDEISCTGIYDNDRAIQLTADTLYIGVRGGLKSITLRFDDQPAERLRLPSDIEKQLDSIFVKGPEFSKLLGSKRLRSESLTLVRGVASHDLDLSGIVEAIKNIQAGCPGEPVAASNSQATLCSELLVARMKEQGVPAEKIAAICAP